MRDQDRHSRGTQRDAYELIQLFDGVSGHLERAPIRKRLLTLGKDSVPTLLDALSNSNPMTRWEAVNLLGMIRIPSSATEVVNFALAEDEVHARWRAFWAASRFDHSLVLKLLIKALRSRRHSRRWRAALMLSVLRQSEGGPVLVEGLNSPVAWERWEALSAIKSLRLGGCELAVTRCLAKSQPVHIRQQAALTLGAIGTPAARKSLARALRDTEPQVRWRASMAMARLGSVSIRALRAQLKIEADQMVRSRIASDLKQLEEDEWQSRKREVAAR